MKRPSAILRPGALAASHRASSESALVVLLVIGLVVGFEALRGLYDQLALQPAEEAPRMALLVALQVTLIPLAIASMFVWLSRRRWSGYGLRGGFRWWDPGVGALAAAIAAVLWHAGSAPPEPSVLPLASGSGSVAVLIAGAGTCVVIAASQELLVRGFLLNETARLLSGRWLVAVVLTALVLGASHAHRGGAAVVVAIGTHIVFGLLYLLSRRNLGLVVLAHSAAALLLVATAP